MRFIVTSGHIGDITQAPALLEGQIGNAVLADSGYDSGALRETIAGMRA
ncbi:transposase [Neorhizobium galegae]|nr:transposase [Neorhizobium galegae]MCQ1575279.1 transposase [Neorhizobium galegae]MCQ1808946.1 transposase [Neorhizobium galegae]MCQ1838739.1 transposase [Neorhizobium galegae]UIY32516.1 transposase [Neorhizobium galegae]